MVDISPGGRHWLACPPGDPAYRRWEVMDAGDMDRLQALGWTVEGPFVLEAEVERLREDKSQLQSDLREAYRRIDAYLNFRDA